MRRTVKMLVTLVTVLLLLFVAGCIPAPAEITPAPVPAPEPTPTPEPAPTPTPTPAVEQGTIEIRVTDPPPADVTSAVVYLTKIEVHLVSENASGWITIIEDEVSFDLMAVIGVEEILGSENVTPGKYTQIRMNVDRVEVITTAGDNITAEVPSGKLKIVRPFNVGAGMTTSLTLDFDGEKSLILAGKGKALFKPVVKLLIEHEEEREREREREREGEEEELEFEGTIEAIAGDNWTMTIDNEEWTVDVSGADIEGEPAVGLEAEVKGTVVNDIIVASEVEIKEPEEEEFEGTIDSIDGDNWTMTIDDEEWTVDVSGADIEGEPAVGLEAEVKGTVVNDIIVASEVKIKEEE